jgi:threonylcarbamoyladenosine tRNA methylthiotransferase MtaB
VTRVSTEFLGCKVSQTDQQQLRETLAQAGYHETARGDVHVVNGCCVTAEAVAKTRQAVRRALSGGSGRVIVTGCAASLPGTPFADLGSAVHVVKERSEATPHAVAALLGRLGCQTADPQRSRRTRQRAFVKVQDGCSFSCAFCVIPLVRGATRSRPVAEILDDARRRVSAGHQEVVLTGVNIGLYRDRAVRAALCDVLRRVAAVDGVRRVRLSSIEVDHLDTPMITALADTANVLPHLHVPLQSGDDAVLAAMRRRYTAARYLERIMQARDAIPDLNVTADVIIGFPTESPDAFAATLRVVRAAGLSRVHAFPYSPRPATRTADADPVTPTDKQARSRIVRDLADQQGRQRRQRLVGGRDEVLIETVQSGVATGYGRDYTPWRIRGGPAAPGMIVTCRSDAVTDDGFVGTLTG